LQSDMSASDLLKHTIARIEREFGDFAPHPLLRGSQTSRKGEVSTCFTMQKTMLSQRPNADPASVCLRPTPGVTGQNEGNIS
jgi:hypothetical protein